LSIAKTRKKSFILDRPSRRRGIGRIGFVYRQFARAADGIIALQPVNEIDVGAALGTKRCVTARGIGHAVYGLAIRLSATNTFA